MISEKQIAATAKNSTILYAYHSDNITFTDTSAAALPFNTNVIIQNIGHESSDGNNTEIEIQRGGIYNVRLQGNLFSNGNDQINVFTQKKSSDGSFVNVPGSNVLATATSNAANKHYLLYEIAIELIEGDVIRFMGQPSTSNVRFEFHAAGGTPPNDYPLEPSLELIMGKLS